MLLAHGTAATVASEDEHARGPLSRCLGELGETAGMDVSGSSFFLSSSRNTVVVKLALDPVDSDLAVYHDTLSGSVEYQMLHRSAVGVAYGSHTLAMIISGSAPDRIMDIAYGADVAHRLRQVFTALGLRMAPMPNDEMEFEAYAFPLEAGDA
jgi:hypothetical protein